jgi:hypothetical protein
MSFMIHRSVIHLPALTMYFSIVRRCCSSGVHPCVALCSCCQHCSCHPAACLCCCCCRCPGCWCRCFCCPRSACPVLFSPSLPLPVLLSSDRGVALPSWPSFLLPIGSLPLAPSAATPIGVGYPYQTVGFSLLSLSFPPSRSWTGALLLILKSIHPLRCPSALRAPQSSSRSSVTCIPLAISCALTVPGPLGRPLCYLSRQPSWPVGGARFMYGWQRSGHPGKTSPGRCNIGAEGHCRLLATTL